MIGLGILLFLCIWGVIAFVIANLLCKTLFRRFTKDAETGETTNKGVLLIFLLGALVFISPILDQLIAYPKWQQLCATTGDFEWGPGMDEKRAFGREYKADFKDEEFNIFPNVTVTTTGVYLYDAHNKELIFKIPHYEYSANAMFRFPTAAGGNPAIFLTSCSNDGLIGSNWDKKFNLREFRN